MQDDLETLFSRWQQAPEGARPTPEELAPDEPELQAQLRQRIARQRRSFETLNSTGPIEFDTADQSERLAGTKESPELPKQIGSYAILGLLGRGGMGFVYRAQQQRPKRNVALKVIASRFVSDQLMRRFDLEVQTLGRLRHPGIAQVYDAGVITSEFGRQPFFAMELIENGLPLDAFVEEHRLEMRSTLELLAKVCDAVQYAHQQGVIHRDLKPENILVTPDGQPKILDFGVARVTDKDVKSVTIQTDVGQIIGTLPYMSPEQASGKPDDVDTRTDVYALGVIGYKLLAGRMPYELANRALAEAVRVIQEEEPDRLSSVSRTYRGDVETIVGKALAKEKSRRYASASDMASDVRRYLANEPIAARPASAWYQVGKFARRNKALVIGAAATVLALVGGVIASTWFALEARQQASLAEARRVEAETRKSEAESRKAEAERREKELAAVVDFTNTDVFNRATPESMPNRAVRDEIVAKMLEPAARTLDRRFKDQPLVRAAVLNQIASSYHSLGRSAEALPLAEEALHLRRAALGADHADTQISLRTYGVILQALGRRAEAEACFREALDRYRRTVGDDHLDAIQVQSDYAIVIHSQGRSAEAEPLLKDALERRRRQLGDDHPDTIYQLTSYGAVLWSLGRESEALPIYRNVMEHNRRTLGEDHPDTITSILRYAHAINQQGRSTEASPLYAEALERSRRVLGDDHPDTIRTIYHAGANLVAIGQLDRAVHLLDEALERSERVLGADGELTFTIVRSRANVLLDLGRADEALAIYEGLIPRMQKSLGEDHSDALSAVLNRAVLLQKKGRAAEAEPILKDVLDRRRRIAGAAADSDVETINAMAKYVSVLADLRRYDDALPLCQEVLERRRRMLGDEHPNTIEAISDCATVLKRLHRTEESAPLYRELLQRNKRALGDDHPDTLDAMYQYANAIALLHYVDDAEPIGRELLERADRNPKLGPSHKATRRYASLYAGILAALDRRDEAAALRARYGLSDPSTKATTAAATQATTQRGEAAQP